MPTPLGYARLAAVVPNVRVADVSFNVAKMLEAAERCSADNCDLAVFPELGITSYSCADLFHQSRLLDAAEAGLKQFCQATRKLTPLFAVGIAARHAGRLFNCAAVIERGRILGVVPKSYNPGYQEFYEPRWFASGAAVRGAELEIAGQRVPLGVDLLFQASRQPRLCIGVEICEDLWAPIPPSSYAALAGANVIVNLSASNELVGKLAYRLELLRHQSAATLSAYAYASAGVGESTTDVVYGGHAVIAENGVISAENQRFQRQSNITCADIDLELLEHERLQRTGFRDAVTLQRLPDYRRIRFNGNDYADTQLRRQITPTPFVPADRQQRRQRCEEIFAIQSSALATRLEHTGLSNIVIGISGGLDSTLALLVVVEAFERLALARSGILALTMPGFGTSSRTRSNVTDLCRELAVPLQEIDIRASCEQHLRDLGHHLDRHDITYENAQARMRTQVLMNKANQRAALVIGTGDLSELALGWCTYNGDHMSMYAVNVGVPKTLVSYLIDYVAEQHAQTPLAATLRDILATPISPELLPPDSNGEIAQKTETVLGPYEVHDFFLYNAIRCGYAPAKVLFLAQQAFAQRYTQEQLHKWLQMFLRRFFQHQFKRSCLPDGPKVGSIALSPRGDWRMPSDASVATWLEQLPEN